jgi:uncharacterized protein YjdB
MASDRIRHRDGATARGDHGAARTANPSIAANTSVQLQLDRARSGGHGAGDRAVVYTLKRRTIAFVSSTGLVVGLRAGEATITATVEGVSGSTLVTVR